MTWQYCFQLQLCKYVFQSILFCCLTLIFQSFAPLDPSWQYAATAVLPSEMTQTNLYEAIRENSSQIDSLIKF
jgi:hypothetical protein